MKKFFLGLGLVAVALTLALPALAQTQPISAMPHWTERPVVLRSTVGAANWSSYGQQPINWGQYSTRHPVYKLSQYWVDSLTTKTQAGGAAQTTKALAFATDICDTSAPISTFDMMKYGPAPNGYGAGDTVTPLLSLRLEDAGTSSVLSTGSDSVFVYLQVSPDNMNWIDVVLDNNAGSAWTNANTGKPIVWGTNGTGVWGGQTWWSRKTIYGASSTAFGNEPTTPNPSNFLNWPYIRFIVKHGVATDATGDGDVFHFRYFYGFWSNRGDPNG